MNYQQARSRAAGILVDQWRSAQEPLNDYVDRVVDALCADPALLVELLRIPRPGPCGAQLSGFGCTSFCTLDAGHAGWHKEQKQGTAWGQVDQ